MSKCWSFLFLTASWFCFETDSVAGACTQGKYGLDCSYTCHCDVSRCHNVIGCSGNCNKGWSGTKCTIANIAFNKRTSQSSYLRSWWKNSSLAIGLGLFYHLLCWGNHGNFGCRGLVLFLFFVFPRGIVEF
ncbi:uncharacterized protein LOC121387131 [Gigantopelta aegis]|uniref:uncharacterized protein LOC121387131 n=1 Tax=Gigantopelta aegis TaxID=1735272 RepID=UPI001B88CA90|nr:uncharacterized protein LOC121387131 [Gigantopelta aegis]